MINELKRQKRIHGLSDEVSDKEIEMLNNNVPIQKIIGFINFDDLRINVNRNVLIPRYETEEVVHEALKFINKDSKVLDLCTGSGYIGLTIKHKTNANVTCSDISDEAISQTKENAELNKLDIQIIKSDMFKNINDKFDVIISNPPYIPNGIKLSESVTSHEPHDALFGGADGNDFYKVIINEGPKHLNNGGTIVLEISEDNKELLESNGFKIKKDINGKDRIAIKTY